MLTCIINSHFYLSINSGFASSSGIASCVLLKVDEFTGELSLATDGGVWSCLLLTITQQYFLYVESETQVM